MSDGNEINQPLAGGGGASVLIAKTFAAVESTPVGLEPIYGQGPISCRYGHCYAITA
jgi:hypothetical protein